MPNRNPKFKLPLPEVVDPERVCMSVMVPNDPNHVAAFRYAILMLASAYNWADDLDHTARDVALVWDSVYKEVSDCAVTLFDVRQNEENPCKLDKTEDGEEWVEWADLQLCPPRLRTNKGKMQWFNGTAWVDLPGGGDERYDGEADPQWTDPPVGQTGNCLAAENIIASYVTMLTQTKAGLDAVATISGIVDVVAGYIGTQTLFPPALLILNISIAIGSLAVLGSGAIEDMIDSPNVDTLKCIINCHASSDGAFTADEFDAIQDDVLTQVDEPTRLIMSEWLNSYGPVGLTRAAAANGILEGDCGDCDCGEYDYSIEYCAGYGSGPVLGRFGDEFEFTGIGSGSGYEGFWAQFSRNVKLTVIDITGYVDGDPMSGATMWWYNTTNGANCDLLGSDHVNFAPQPVGAAGFSGELWHFGHLSHSTGTFHLTVKVEVP